MKGDLELLASTVPVLEFCNLCQTKHCERASRNFLFVSFSLLNLANYLEVTCSHDEFRSSVRTSIPRTLSRDHNDPSRNVTSDSVCFYVC